MKLLNVLLLLCFGISVQAQKPIFTNASMDHTTLYLNSAELSHNASVSLKKGTNEIVIKNVANQLDENSIRIEANKSVTILSAVFSNQYYQEYEVDPNSVLSKMIKDSIEIVDRQVKIANNQIATEQQAIQLLDKNQAIGGEKGVAVEELTKMVNYYRQKRLEIANNIDDLTAQRYKLQQTLQKLKNQLTTQVDEEEKISEGKIIIQVMSDIAQTVKFEFSYITKLAKWTPAYEVEVTGIDQPLHLLTKGKVVQTTGFDWKKVHLSLSSTQPNPNNAIPAFDRWVLSENQPIRYQETQIVGGVSIRGSRDSGDYYYLDGVKVRGSSPQETTKKRADKLSTSAANYTTVTEQILNVSYDVDLPYDIASNGKENTVKLIAQDIPASYKYFAAPKLDNNAYLVGSITDYSNYNILAGEANITFEGKYVGKTFLDPASTEDTLKIALGIDQSVVVERKKVAEKSGSKFFSGTKESAYTYEIHIRNQKKTPIQIEVKDQFPLSPSRDITVEVTNSSKAKENEEMGTFTWELDIKPQETQKVSFGYKVIYPKDKVLYNL